jgi:hypothetical protein
MKYKQAGSVAYVTFPENWKGVFSELKEIAQKRYDSF